MTIPAARPYEVAPERTLDQRMEALRKANDIRLPRAQLRKRIKQGEEHVVDVLKAPPPYIRTMKIYELLKCQPKMGPKKTAKLLAKLNISMNRSVDGLSTRQYEGLITELEERRKQAEADRGVA